MNQEQEYLYAIALMKIEGIGNVTARTLINYLGSAEKILVSPKRDLLKIPNIGEITAQKIIENASSVIKEAEQELKKISNLADAHIFYYKNKDYPQRFIDIPDSPIIFFSKGKVEWNNSRTIAIVGTRAATDYGKQITEQLIQDLKEYKPIIVSGLAYGIDIIAHRASLKNQLPTVAVMATGLNKVYPSVHEKTASQIVAQGGALVTENFLDTQPDAMRFPARNRIIAGLADVTVVVEARATGGALITAEIANGYNRDVLAFPGSIFSKTSEGCNKIIREHKAHLITHAQDLVDLLRWDPSNKSHKSTQISLDFSGLDLNAEEEKIMQLLQKNRSENKELSIDELGIALEMSHNVLNASLLNLELWGLVKTLPGKKFRIS